MSWVKLFVIALLIISVLIVWLTFEVWAAGFLGVLFALSLNGPAEWMRSKWHMPAWLATVLSMLMVVAVLTGLGFVIGPPLVKQADELGRKLPAAMEQTFDWLDDREWGRSIVQRGESLSGMSAGHLKSQDKVHDGHQILGHDLTTDESQQYTLDAGGQEDAAPEQSDDDNDGKENENDDGDGNEESESTDDGGSIFIPILKTLGTMLTVTAWTIMLISVTFVVTLYVAFNPEVYRRGIVWMIPPEHEEVATLTMTRMCGTLRWWMLGRLASMLAVGLLTSLGMWLIGMPAPLALGALAGLLTFVPNVGPIVAAAPGLLLAIPEGGWMILYVLGVYVAAQMVESYLVSPLVDQFTVTIPPAVLIFVQLIMAVLAGVWGVLVATPMLVVAMVLTQQLYVREYIKRPIKVVGTDEDETQDGDNDKGALSP